jgi:hypothetical protein
MRLSGAQSPFARSGCYPSRRDLENLVSRHYPAFFAPTDSCADPKPSSCLGKPLVHQVFAGCCQPLLRVGPSRRYLCESFLTCLDPYPGCSCGALTRFFPQDNGLPDAKTRSARSLLRPWQNPYSNFSRERFSRLQSFTDVQAREFARHPDCSYRRAPLFRSSSSIRRVRWVSHRFRFGPQSDSRRCSQLPAAHRAAVASTSPPISVCYLSEQGIC